MSCITPQDDEITEICKLLNVDKNKINYIEFWFSLENYQFNMDLYEKIVKIFNIRLEQIISLDIKIECGCIVTATAEFYPVRRNNKNAR